MSRPKVLAVLGGVLAVVLVLGGLVGYARGQLTRESGGDAVWSTRVPYDGNLQVEGPNVVVDPPSDRGYSVVRLADGRVLRDGLGTDDGVVIGTDGSFVVFGSSTRTPNAFTAYDAEGRRRWERRFGHDTYVAAITNRQVVLHACAGSRCRLEAVGPRGTTAWRHELGTDVLPGARADDSLDLDRDPNRSNQLVAPDTAVASTGGAYSPLVVLDDMGRPTGPTAPNDDSVLYRGGLSALRVDGRCRFAGAMSWTARVDCREVRSGTLAALHGDLLYAYVTLADGSGRVLVVDLRTHRGHLTKLDGSTSGDGEAKEVALGSGGVVARDGAAFRGIDPLTGRTLWRYDAPGPDGPGVDDHPLLRLDGDTLAILGEGPPWWRRLALGKQVPARTTDLRDARTGERFGLVRADGLRNVAATPRGAVVLVDGRLLRVDR